MDFFGSFSIFKMHGASFFLIIQKIALAWMLQKETASLHCLGGILADDQVVYLA